jgi:hypothetical protein
MELKLEKLIDNLVSISNVQDMDVSNSIVVRMSNTLAAKISVVVCSINEPLNMILPLNVSWLNLDPASHYYKKILVRSSKTASAEFSNTWAEVLYYADVMKDQYYDDADRTALTESANIGDATDTTKGITKLSVAPTNLTSPIAVGEGDPRLTNDRTPLPHTHPLQPAESIKTATNVVVLNTAAAPLSGQVLMAISPTEAKWTTLTAADIH